MATLYIYELQLEESIRRKGLGKFLMQVCELIARKQQFVRMLLQVFSANTGALGLYKEALKFQVDETSPNFKNPLNDAGYEILSKYFTSTVKPTDKTETT